MVLNEGYRIEPTNEKRLKTPKRTQKDNTQLYNNNTPNFCY